LLVDQQLLTAVTVWLLVDQQFLTAVTVWLLVDQRSDHRAPSGVDHSSGTASAFPYR
jgi:hypothetical protein